jgi:hypothetical protein
MTRKTYEIFPDVIRSARVTSTKAYEIPCKVPSWGGDKTSAAWKDENKFEKQGK